MTEDERNKLLQKNHEVNTKLGHAQKQLLSAYFILRRSNPDHITNDLHNKLLTELKLGLTLSGIDLSSYKD